MSEPVDLREHLEALIACERERMDVRLAALRLELDSTAETLKARLLIMNEFRDQLNRERGDYVTKEVLDAIIDPLKKQQAEWSGRDKVVWALLGALIPVIVAVVVKVFVR